jgi:hypothetical protein
MTVMSYVQPERPEGRSKFRYIACKIKMPYGHMTCASLELIY